MSTTIAGLFILQLACLHGLTHILLPTVSPHLVVTYQVFSILQILTILPLPRLFPGSSCHYLVVVFLLFLFTAISHYTP